MQKGKFCSHFKNKNVLLDIFGQCSYYLVMLENAVKLRQCIKSKSGINNYRISLKTSNDSSIVTLLMSLCHLEVS